MRPDTAASVSTRVVSWKDAAEMNDLVCKDALVIPSSTGSALAGFSFSEISLAFSCSYSCLSICSPIRKVESPASVISTFCSI